MSDTINVMLYRAQPTGIEETPHLNITTNSSYFPDTVDQIDVYNNMVLHRKQAKDLVDALYKTIPGGTLDQVLRELLERKASQLVVTF